MGLVTNDSQYHSHHSCKVMYRVCQYLCSKVIRQLLDIISISLNVFENQ